MKFKTSLPLLLLSCILFTGCVERIERTITHNQKSINLEYDGSKEDLTKRISTLVPSEEVILTTSVTRINKDPEFHTILLEIKNPEDFPENGFSFSSRAEDLKEEVLRGVTNLEDFEKLEIKLNRINLQGGTEHLQTYKKEFDL